MRVVYGLFRCELNLFSFPLLLYVSFFAKLFH
uniref:Uncharacterized protein n=1 Tax=Arundo donax TaxID=35708 RepID=A0A0A9FZK1_ARUDO